MTPNTDNHALAIALAKDVRDLADQRADLAVELAADAARNYQAGLAARADMTDLASALFSWTMGELQKVLATYAKHAAQLAYDQVVSGAAGGGA